MPLPISTQCQPRPAHCTSHTIAHSLPLPCGSRPRLVCLMWDSPGRTRYLRHPSLLSLSLSLSPSPNPIIYLSPIIIIIVPYRTRRPLAGRSFLGPKKLQRAWAKRNAPGFLGPKKIAEGLGEAQCTGVLLGPNKCRGLGRSAMHRGCLGPTNKGPLVSARAVWLRRTTSPRRSGGVASAGGGE